MYGGKDRGVMCRFDLDSKMESTCTQDREGMVVLKVLKTTTKSALSIIIGSGKRNVIGKRYGSHSHDRC